jgi:methionyl-tRNA formyltransferase
MNKELKSPRIIFMGTPEFAVPTLEKLHEVYGVSAVVTVPDRPKGRGRKLSGSPVKDKAVELNIPVLQPESLKDESFIEELKSYNADIFCVLAFRILPEEVFNIPKIASFNIHGSLLPKYRGAAPINRAIMNGETKTGLTSFILKKMVDTGNILMKKGIYLPNDWTAGDLHDNLMPMAADLSIETCELLISKNYAAQSQNEGNASPAPKIFRLDCKIDWNKSQNDVYNHIRGLSPFPSAWTILNEKEIKIHFAEFSDTNKIKAGNYLIENAKFIVGTLDGNLELKLLKPEGKKIIIIEDFIRGFRGEKSGAFK